MKSTHTCRSLVMVLSEASRLLIGLGLSSFQCSVRDPDRVDELGVTRRAATSASLLISALRCSASAEIGAKCTWQWSLCLSL